MNDISDKNYVTVYFEFGEYDLFEREKNGLWHHEHWGRKRIWEYEENGLRDEDVLCYMNNFPKKINFDRSYLDD